MILYLLRHGATKLYSETGKDFDRKLSEIGKKQLKKVKSYLEVTDGEKEFTVFCSSAIRTKETWNLIESGIETRELTFEDKLYHANCDFITQFLRRTKPTTDIVLLIGHNNGISDFASFLLDKSVVFPTSGLIKIEFPIINEWRYIGRGTGGEMYRVFA